MTHVTYGQQVVRVQVAVVQPIQHDAGVCQSTANDHHVVQVGAGHADEPSTTSRSKLATGFITSSKFR